MPASLKIAITSIISRYPDRTSKSRMPGAGLFLNSHEIPKGRSSVRIETSTLSS